MWKSCQICQSYRKRQQYILLTKYEYLINWFISILYKDIYIKNYNLNTFYNQKMAILSEILSDFTWNYLKSGNYSVWVLKLQ